MRQLLRTILRILDGSPGAHMASRNRQRGQSLLELAFITPLLAFLVAGAVEVGWYTNRWLSLLEVTRVGARSATFLTNELSPIQWNNDASVAPPIYTELMGGTVGDSVYNRALNARNCETNSNFGFYSFTVCLMQSSLEPLELTVDFVDPLDADNEAQEEAEAAPGYSPRDYPSYDDIVVSVFSIQTVNNARRVGYEADNEGVPLQRPVYRTWEFVAQDIDPASRLFRVTYDLDDQTAPTASGAPYYPPGIQSIVVGRYPTNANECTHQGTSKDDMELMVSTDPGFEKDPFDYLDADNGAVTFHDPPGSGEIYPLELTSTDGLPLADNGTVEFQRGFSLTGQHRIDDPDVFCYGSEFGIREVEELLNMPGFIQPDLYDPPTTDTSAPEYIDWVDEVYASQDQRMFFEPQGMTLVEIFWRHDLLLRFPFFRPITDAFGDSDEIVIALWSAFPLPSAAPNIIYQLP